MNLTRRTAINLDTHPPVLRVQDQLCPSTTSLLYEGLCACIITNNVQGVSSLHISNKLYRQKKNREGGSERRGGVINKYIKR